MCRSHERSLGLPCNKTRRGLAEEDYIIRQHTTQQHRIYTVHINRYRLANKTWPLSSPTPAVMLWHSSMAVWRGGNSVGHIRQGTPRRAPLVLRWVTVCRYTSWHVNSHLGQLSCCTLSGRGNKCRLRGSSWEGWYGVVPAFSAAHRCPPTGSLA